MTYLSLGSNLGDRIDNLEMAVSLIGRKIGHVVAKSDVIETEPWGFESDNRFLNQAIAVETSLEPEQLLEATQAIEKECGRSGKSIGGNYSDRVIDIDILLMDQLTMSTDRLTIPHPLMTKRRFVLEPLSGIAPDLIHPVSGMTVSELLEQLQ